MRLACGCVLDDHRGVSKCAEHSLLPWSLILQDALNRINMLRLLLVERLKASVVEQPTPSEQEQG